ncbi:MAG: HK97 gp10 family phage protein [Flexilinea sp.]
MSIKKINATEFELAFAEILKDYKDLLTSATEEGLDDAAEALIRNAQSMSPRKTGRYARNWAVYPKKYHLKRYVGNKTVVKGWYGTGMRSWAKERSPGYSESIPLINILEYSTGPNRRPHAQKIFNASVQDMVDAIEKKMKQGVQE